MIADAAAGLTLKTLPLMAKPAGVTTVIPYFVVARPEWSR